MAIVTAATRLLNIEHPIILAPMGGVAGGRLAAAVTEAGGLGIIGGGYGDPRAGYGGTEFIEREFRAAGNARVGVGYITWSMARFPHLLDEALAHKPAAFFLSFGDERPFASRIKSAGSLLICQVQDVEGAKRAADAGADLIVAQGTEAGGHGKQRGTLSLVPEVADYLTRHAPETPLVAAGGIADGRGLAASLMLGADGVLLGTRLWASDEALVAPGHHAAILETGGDGTVRTEVADIARQIAWPRGFTARIRQNAFTDRWHGREEALRASASSVAPTYRQAFAAGDPENTGVWFGEAAGLIDRIEPAAQIVTRLCAEARALLTRPF